MHAVCFPSQVFEWPYVEDEECLSYGVSPNLQRLLQFARMLPGRMEW